MTFNPTPAQEEIISFIEANPETSCFIDARAGAAKTSTIVLAAQHIGPQFTPLSIAFNKKNAEELGARMPEHFTSSTLNALGHRAWGARLGKRLQVDADKMHKIAKSVIQFGNDEESQEIFTTSLNLARAAKSVGLVPKADQKFGSKGIVPDERDSWDDIAFSKGMLTVPDEAIINAREMVSKSIALAWKGEIDFDDQIYMSVLFGGTYSKYHTVIVDEAQDLSALNHLQIAKIVKTRLIIVGDPFQAIYGFRGASSNSINELMDACAHVGPFTRLTLSKSFRVPHAVSRRQIDHVADFGSMDFLKEGEVQHWPRHENQGPPDGQLQSAWSLDAIPTHGAVLCRNNAPLLALAFAMIKSRRPVQILGRDIGATLANLLLKITGKNSTVSILESIQLLDAWKAKEIEKVGDSESKQDAIYDRWESLHVLLDAGDKANNQEAASFIRDLFSDKPNEYKTTFASIHRAKGLEWDWVMLLDPQRIPSIQATKAAARGNPGPLEQEMNLRYVGETRTKHTLVLAALEDCLEVGE